MLIRLSWILGYCRPLWVAGCLLAALCCLAGPLTPERRPALLPLDGGWASELRMADGAVVQATLPLPHRWEPTTISAVYRHDVTFTAEAEATGAWLAVQHPVGILEVRLDDRLLETHLGNGLTYRWRLRGAAGPHRLELRLTREHLPEALAAAACGLGPVTVEPVPPAIFLSLSTEFNATLRTVTVHYRAASAEPETVTLKLRLLAPGERRPALETSVPVALTSEGLTGSRTVRLKQFQAWSPDHPAIYTLQASLVRGSRVYDQWELPCGLCALTVTSSGAWLNGQPITLKGLRIRGGLPPLGGGDIADTLERELRLAKQAGFNALMAEGAALPEEALALANRLGLLVIADVPPTWSEPGASTLRPDLATIVAELGHHPCVAAWSWAESGMLQQNLTALRAVDRARSALVRAGVQSQVYGPFVALGKPVADIDTSGQPLVGGGWADLLAKAEGGKQPLLVSGLGGSAEAVSPVQLSADVAAVRRTAVPLGYFIRPLAGPTLTGLGDEHGTPTRLFVTAATCNQPCILILRPGKSAADNPGLALDAVIINDQSLTGNYRLFGLVVAPDASTALIDRAITLTGARVQPITPLAGMLFPQYGDYRIQLALADGETILTSALLTVTVEER